jgi:predicted TIM-barrel fold metal-dependent hydrolase
MIIDAHAHLLTQPGYEHHLAKAAHEADIEKMVLMGGPKQYDYASNDQVLAAAERYPELFVPFAYFRLGHDYPALVAQFHTEGFRGLHFALPQKDYDDKGYYLAYAQAGQLGMPCVFELGLLPNSGRDHVHDVCCGRMRPICLDTVARAFPELTIIGTRLGSPWCEEACEVARCNGNVYLDLSGSVLRRLPPEQLQRFLWWGAPDAERSNGPPPVGPWNKILFGSGVHCKYLADVRDDYMKLLSQLSLDAETMTNVMARNAIRALGLDY